MRCGEMRDQQLQVSLIFTSSEAIFYGLVRANQSFRLILASSIWKGRISSDNTEMQREEESERKKIRKWERNRGQRRDGDQWGERERESCVAEGERKVNKIIKEIIEYLSIRSHIWDRTVATSHNFETFSTSHEGLFLVFGVSNAKYLAFGTPDEN